MHRDERHGLRGRLSCRLHSSTEGRAGVCGGGNAVYPSRRVHRLRRLRAGLPGRGDLRARRDTAQVVVIHRQKPSILRVGIGIDY